MTRARSLVTLIVLVVAVSSALAATASAEQRAWSCGKGTGFTDAHCLNLGSGPFGLIEIPSGTETTITATNVKTASETTAATASVLSATVSGVATELECTGVTGTGALTNASGSVSGTGRLTYSGCVVLKPAGKGCKVTSGTINSEELRATTVGQSANKLKFEQIGPRFANVDFEGCSIAALNTTHAIVGSLVANTNGATVTSTKTEIEAQNTLRFSGGRAGLGGAITISDSAGGVVLK
jgi:hypothetical protein